MELDYSEIHHSRKIRGTEQAESTEDKRFRELLTTLAHFRETDVSSLPQAIKVRRPSQTETHSFSDSGDNRIGQTYYLRMINQRNKVQYQYHA